MVDDRLTDGRRIAQLLASELDGLGGVLAAVAVTDADRDADPTPDGAYAYRVTLRDRANGSGGDRGDADRGGGDRRDGAEGDDDDHADDADRLEREREQEQERELAVVFVHPDRARVEFVAGQDVAAATARGEGLRVRPKAVRPPRTLVFVEDGAAVKRAVAVFEATVDALATNE
ncbi:hypothetical protein [Salinigranum salinum]|uniref:hypothetical protein n=1 Tax=Salinigranum salinum TaxID=1364937 RepID=UPI001260CD4B|nr:hypothetical protein [Salinigranum salinum]